MSTVIMLEIAPKRAVQYLQRPYFVNVGLSGKATIPTRPINYVGLLKGPLFLGTLNYPTQSTNDLFAAKIHHSEDQSANHTTPS